MKVKFTAEHEQPNPASALLGLLTGKEPETPDCPCVPCTARRIATQEPIELTDEQKEELLKRSGYRALRAALQAKEACGAACSRMVERPSPFPGFAEVVYRRRVDEYNAVARLAADLFERLPESFRKELEYDAPELVSWEEAIGHLERIRGEINEAVLKCKEESATDDATSAAAADLGTTLAGVINEARKGGATEEEITAVIRNAALRAKESMAAV